MDETRYHLRQACQAGDRDRIEAILADEPGLLFTDEADLQAILAVALVMLQRQEDAAEQLRALAPNALSDTAGLADYGLALILVGQNQAAQAVLNAAASRPDAGFEVFARLGALAVTAGELEAAERAFGQALALNPDQPEVLSNLGGVHLRSGRFGEALECYDRALRLKPQLVQIQQMRARALASLDRVDELIAEKQDVVEANPDNPLAHLNLAQVQLEGDRFDEAEATLEAAIDRFPEVDGLKRALLEALGRRSKHWRAGVLLKQWVEEREEPDWTSLALNRTRIEAGLHDAARESLEALQDTRLAHEPAYWVLRGKLLFEMSRAEEAAALLQETLERFPGHQEARMLLSHVLTALGRTAEATEQVDAVSSQGPMAVVRYVSSKDYEADDTEIAALKRLVQSPHLGAEPKASAAFCLGFALDKRKDHDGAFAAIAQANRLVKRRLSYDWRQHRRLTERIRRTITEAVVAEKAGLGHASRRPIFVCGMPRSGTTLTEQVLCSHPDVHGGGELPWAPRLTRLMPKVVEKTPYPAAIAQMTEHQLKSAAVYYLDKIRRLNDTAPRLVDKMPHNFDNIGLIALMFPNASIIHMKRDPRDVAVSNYFQNFAAAQGLMGFAFDLETIGHMLNDHDAVMAHWHQVFPGRIYELDYARLVSDPETVIAELLDFCGLPWDEAVLRFYETQRPVRTASIRQVRKGFYTSSTEKWRRYEAHLGPLDAVLAEGYKPLSEADHEAAAQRLVAGVTALAATL